MGVNTGNGLHCPPPRTGIGSKGKGVHFMDSNDIIMENYSSGFGRGDELSREEVEIISTQGTKNVFRVELDTGAAVRFLADGSCTTLPGMFPGWLIENGNICPESAQDITALVEAARRREPGSSCGIWMNTPHGRRWCVVEYSLLPESDCPATRAIITMHDETELHEREQAYEKWRESLLTMFAENASYAEFNLTKGVLERQTGMPVGSAGARSGCTISEFVDYACEHLIYEEDREDYREFFDRERLLALSSRGVTEDTLEYRDCEKGVQWMRATVQMTGHPGSTDLKAFIVYTNIDHQRSELERLAQLASRDSLTNILNRKALEDRITERLRSAAPDELSALYIIDLDNFKQINDRFGHQAGDDTLRSVAAALNNTFRSGDIVGRLGGDEFMAFISGVSERNAISRANRLLNELQFLVENAALSASVGLALCMGKADFSALYRSADVALYKSKDMGKSRCTVHRVTDHQDVAGEEVDESKKSSMIQLQTLLEYMDGGVIIVDLDGDDVREIYISPSYYTTMRRAPGKAPDGGRALFDGIIDEHKPVVMNALKKTSGTGEPTDTIYQVVVAGGTEWHHLRAARLPGMNGEQRIIGVVTDVSELKQSSSQLEAIVEYSTVGIAMFELSGGEVRTTFVNPKLESMLGLDIDRINAHPEIARRLAGGDQLRPAREGRSGSDTFEFTCCGSDFSDVPQELYLQARGVHIYDSASAAVVLVMYLDITRERAIEEKLRMAEERYRIAAAQTGLFIWEVDIAARTMRLLNTKAENPELSGAIYTNVPESQLESGLIHRDSEEALRVMYSDILAGRESDEYVLRRLDDSGAYVWARARYTIIRDAQGKARHAVGVSEPMPNIDSELRELRRIWQFSGLVEDMLMANIHVNLTRDKVDYIHVSGMEPEEYSSLTTFEQCKTLLCAVMADNDENNALVSTVTREWLMELYRQGRSAYSFVFRTAAGEGWGNGSLDLLRDPLSGDIWCFVYLRDIGHRRTAEMLIGEDVNYDTVTQLYDYATVRRAMDAVLSTAQRSCWAVISVLSFTGLEDIKKQQGMDEANRALNIIGRLIRLLIGDTAIYGHITQDKLVVLHTNVDTIDEWRAAMQQGLDRANDLLHRCDVVESARMVCGYSFARTEDTDCTALIRQASVACTAAANAGLGVAVYSEAELGALPENTDNLAMGDEGTPELAELSRKYHALELRYQQLANQHMASDYDQTTGLYSYSAFCRAVQKRLDNGERELAIVACEIRRLGAYCSVNGRAAGDRMVRRLAKLAAQETGIAGRNDRSCILALVPASGLDADRLLEALRGHVTQNVTEPRLDVRVGIYHAQNSGLSAVQMCDSALAVMREAEEGGWISYDPEQHDRLLNDHELLSSITTALRDEQFVMYYQPQIDCRSGRIEGIDAYLYWDHPELGLLPPKRFVPLFESRGMMGYLTEYVIERCCIMLRNWTKKHGSPVPVHLGLVSMPAGVNVRSLRRSLDRMTDRFGTDKRALCIGISERFYLEDAETLAVLVKELKDGGYTVGVNSFGSGGSSINAILDIPFDNVKMGRDFLNKCLGSTKGKKVLSALFNAVNQMDIMLIASGVDDEAAAETLKKLGCRIMQGSCFAQPMPEKQLLECSFESMPASRSSGERYWYSWVEPSLELDDREGAAFMLDQLCGSQLCGVIAFDCDERLTMEYANTEACRIFAARRKNELYDFAHSSFAELVLPEDNSYLRRCVDRLLAGEAQVSFECRAQDTARRVGWINGILRLVTRADSRRAVVCEFLDVTHHHSEEQEQLLSSYSEALMTCFNEICELNFDAQTITVRYSGYGNRMLGVARPLRETVDALCRTHVVPEDGDKLRNFIDRVSSMNTTEHLSIEYDLRGRDGRVHTIYSRAVAINSTRCLLCNTDISQRKRLALQREDELLRVALRRERENYYSMVERLGSTIVEWDLTDGTCWCSDSCARYAMNSTGGSVTGSVMGSGVHSEDMVRFAMFMSQLESGSTYAETTLRMRMADGSHRWTRLNGEAVRDQNGLPVRMLVSMTDIDDGIRSQQEIADYTSRSSAFIENIPSGVIIADISRRGVNGTANECFCSLVGYTGEQLVKTVHKRWTDIVAPGDREWIEDEIRGLVLGEQKQIDVICSLRHRKGYDVPVRVLAALIGQQETSTSIAFICIDEQVDT